MPAVTPDLGFGTTIVLTLGQTPIPVLARVISLSWTGIERTWIDTTTLATVGGKTFVPSDVYDPGTIEAEIQFDSDSDMVGAMNVAQANPLVLSTITVTFPDAETWVATGGLATFGIDVPAEGVMTSRVTLKVTGNITP
jgi:carotenoid cleavage dioxygenase-like enzyme